MSPMKIVRNILCLILVVLFCASSILPAYAATSFTAMVDPAPNSSAPIAVVMDYYTGEILYERNMEQRWIPASMTKSMAAFIVYQEIEAGNLSFDTEIRVSPEAARFSSNRRVSGSFVPLPSGELITVDTLLQLLLIPSGNAAAVVFAEHISGSEEAFVERMNETAAELGMYAEYTNSHGAFVNYTNAHSTAILIREFITQFPDVLRITNMPNVRFRGRTYRNTNHLVSRTRFPGCDGFKTGSLRQAGWNHSTTAERDGRRIIAVVMNTASNSARQRQSRILLEFGFEELERREAERVDKARVFFSGELIPLTTLPRIYNGRLSLPTSDIMEHLDYSVRRNEEHGLVTVLHENGLAATLFEDRDLAIINGDTITLPSPVQIIGEQMYFSVEVIGLLTETVVDWSLETGVIRFR